ncbi:MAG: DUF3846 domain-containing protein [Acetobacter sp.]|nr:DUF3846 domain-containing protein [Bacteroides sp.]MCM1341871.1 DUF3846 domain-containing protein [Acetobacter sp.]MCM1433168.1 DUF3846 domain-containing protein [Clostridiales bacterium]
MPKNKAYVLLVEPKSKPRIIQIEDDEQAIKSIVGGEIDRIKIPSDDVTILFQKDAVKNGKMLNRVAIIKENVPVVNQILADNFIVAHTPKGENTLADITQELVDKYFKQFEKPDKFHRNKNGEIIVIGEKSNSEKAIER